MHPVPDPLEPRKSFLFSRETRDQIIIIVIAPILSVFVGEIFFDVTEPSYLKVKALNTSEGLQDFGGHCGGHHINLLSVCWIWMVLLPVKEHPPTQQSCQFITCEHLPTTPETQGHTGKHPCDRPQEL